MTQPSVRYSVGWKSQFLQHATRKQRRRNASVCEGPGIRFCKQML